MEELRKKFGIELLPSLHKKLKQRALDLQLPLWAVIQEAIQRWLGEEPTDRQSSLKPRDREAHKLLQVVLDSGDTKAIDWITGNLSMFNEAIESRKKPLRKLGS